MDDLAQARLEQQMEWRPGWDVRPCREPEPREHCAGSGRGTHEGVVVRRSLPGNLVLAAGAGYLIGSIPWADLAAHRATEGQVDLRAAGSGNPGALNAIEVLGKRWGYAVGVADVAKGVVASLVGRALAGDVGAHVGGTAAVVGHCYPVWKGFRGGRGMACACGQCLATFPAAVPVELAAVGVGVVGPFEHRSYAAAVCLTTTWVGAGLVWWWRDWPNAWGPKPTVALPVAAALSGGLVLYRLSRRPRERSTGPRTSSSP